MLRDERLLQGSQLPTATACCELSLPPVICDWIQFYSIWSGRIIRVERARSKHLLRMELGPQRSSKQKKDVLTPIKNAKYAWIINGICIF